MRAFHEIPGERSLAVSPVGLWLKDELSGAAPQGRIEARLEIRDGASWLPVDVAPARSGAGRFTWPGLGRTSEPGEDSTIWRVLLSCELYRPWYRRHRDGLEFPVWPYDHLRAPRHFALTSQVADDWRLLLPGVRYPFPSHLAVIRGEVRETDGSPVTDALVSFGIQERALTDEGGRFAIPVRWPPVGQPGLTLDVEHIRTARTGQHLVPLPDGFRMDQTITLS